MKEKRSIVFITELLLLFVLLLVVISVIARISILNRSRGLDARHLTEAVILAEDTAEVISAAEDEEEALELIRSMNVTESAEAEDGKILCVMRFTGEDDKTDEYRLTVSLNEEERSRGTLRTGTIDVFFGKDADALYTLDTGCFINAE